jgi:predicted RNA-binding protein Jag
MYSKICLIKVWGSEDHVIDAQQRIQAIINKYNDENHSIVMKITSACIPIIIGTKGSKIKSLKDSCNVKLIDVDRSKMSVIIKGR